MDYQQIQTPSVFADRWEQLKPVIEHLYMAERKSVAEVATTMKMIHGFDAIEHQYKYHFKKWKWKRNIPKRKKEQIASQLQQRAAAGKNAGAITYKGRQVPQHTIRRHLKEASRKEIQVAAPYGTTSLIQNGRTQLFANGVFIKWNIPNAALEKIQSRPFHHASPAGLSAASPNSDIFITTPPASAASPNNAPSPTTALVQRKLTVDRAHLFIRGDHDKLLKSMSTEEKLVMSEWLYQYWLFCFKTAKNWGKGPRRWTADSLGFQDFTRHAHKSLPGTPRDGLSFEQQGSAIGKPTDLCRWFIHLREDQEEDYESLPDSPITEETLASQDPLDESTWSPWPESWKAQSLQSTLRDALEHNDFSTIKIQNLPVAIPQVARTTERSSGELLLESLAFSIMGRNLAQVRCILHQFPKADSPDFTTLYPFHLATTYLDGHKSCCAIIQSLLKTFLPNLSILELYVNDVGHTVLDNLMVTILKSHTSMSPDAVDNAFKATGRFPGVDVDICGRWDADSDCFRQLLVKGSSVIPFSWKHKFCHSSAQAVCHCITLLLEWAGTRVKETPSGLYRRQCFNCGLKLELSPLHALVVTAYHLACHGCEDEDLFGVLACLLCFVANGITPLSKASISLCALTEDVELESACDHEELTAADLADRLSFVSTTFFWTIGVQTGWKVFCKILRICQENFEDDTEQPASDDEDLDFIGSDAPTDLYDNHLTYHDYRPFGDRRDIASLWASIQAELSTYRRLNDGCAWISEYFNMNEVLECLERGEPVSVRFMRENLLKTHCVCGSLSTVFTSPQDVTREYIANLDVWQRATYHMTQY